MIWWHNWKRFAFPCSLAIEYDEIKNQKNIQKHHISIPELATIWSNPFSPPITDIHDRTVNGEKRYHAYGWTTTGWYVKIWYCYRGEDTIRIIGGKRLK